MKKITILIVLALTLITSCKNDKKHEIATPEPVLTILQKVAYAHGFESWKNVDELKFTFNVDRDTTHFERDWSWKPKTNEVSGRSFGESISYNRNALDSTSIKSNGAFVNDKYWLLAPYQLVWDASNFTHEYHAQAEAPISKKSMQKLTIVYGSEGGYTPGDAYDFYFGDDYMIQEWVFRKGNQAAPSMTTTWEDYTVLNGLKIAKTHKNAEGNFKLHFTGLAIN
tara:strand:+ start:8962 stop:9636 length:675 start_codon:yes stop_codon:yes gene_type:complete